MSSKIPNPEKLPPIGDSLYYHCKRVSYVTAIIKNALDRMTCHPSPDGFEWKVDDDWINVTWMAQKPAPDDILDLVSLCRTNESRCLCISHGIPFTDVCSCKDYDNMIMDEFVDETTMDITDNFDSDLE